MKNILVRVGQVALLTALHLCAYALPTINVTGAGPWADFSVNDSNQIVFEFERYPASGTSSLSMELPVPGATFTFTKDGIPCEIENSSNCSGSEVRVFSNASGTIEISNISEAPVGSLFRVKIESPATGDWQATATANATIQFVHTIPLVDVLFPAEVPWAETGITLDATGSHSVYEPAASTPALTFDWQQTAGPSINLTPSAEGDSATFDAPSVTAVTGLEVQLTVTDGVFTAMRPFTVMVRPPTGEVPVGGIVPYSGEPDDLPDNWTICDGKTITDPTSPLNGQSVPDLRGMFVRGVNNTHPRDTLGGQDTAPNHSHPSPVHSHSLASHRHGLPSHAHSLGRHDHSGANHTHSLPSHAHSLPEHAHSLPSHSHSSPAHTHSLPEHAHSSPEHAHSLPEHAHSLPEHAHSSPSHAHSLPSHAHSLPNHAHETPAHSHSFSDSASVYIPAESVQQWTTTIAPANGAFTFDDRYIIPLIENSDAIDPKPKKWHDHDGTASVDGSTGNASGSTLGWSGTSGFKSDTSGSTAVTIGGGAATSGPTNDTSGNVAVSTSAESGTSGSFSGTTGEEEGTSADWSGTSGNSGGITGPNLSWGGRTGAWSGTSSHTAGTSHAASGYTGTAGGVTGQLTGHDNRPRFHSLYFIIRIK